MQHDLLELCPVTCIGQLAILTSDKGVLARILKPDGRSALNLSLSTLQAGIPNDGRVLFRSAAWRILPSFALPKQQVRDGREPKGAIVSPTVSVACPCRKSRCGFQVGDNLTKPPWGLRGRPSRSRALKAPSSLGHSESTDDLARYLPRRLE